MGVPVGVLCMSKHGANIPIMIELHRGRYVVVRVSHCVTRECSGLENNEHTINKCTSYVRG